MELPKEIKIGNRIVTVEFSDDKDDEYLSDVGAMGFYDIQNFRIVIAANLKQNNPTQVVETFWHELMHAINDSIRFRFELENEMRDKDSIEEDAWKFEERIAEDFARTFLQVIQDNDLLPTTK